VPIIWVKYYAPSGLLVNNYAHPSTPLTSKEHQYPIAGLCRQFLQQRLLMATLDVVENACVAVMLWTWPDLSNAVVELSSFATQVKIIAGALTEMLMAGLAIVWLVRLFARRWV